MPEYIAAPVKYKETKRGLLPFGKKISKNKAHAKRIIHPIVAVLIADNGRFLLQKRRSDDDDQPSKLDWSAAGHIKYGETIEQAVHRETMEEIGVSLPKGIKFKRKPVHLTPIHRHFVIRLAYEGQRIRPGNEVNPKGTRFYSKKEITQNMYKLTRSLRRYLKRIKVLKT
jgi:ADP-ribose pyrophosphatase YjhB (NUDIX family)